MNCGTERKIRKSYIEENERMKWGNILQDAIAAGIAEEQGWKIRRMDEYIRGTDLHLGSSFDWSIEDEEPGLLEIKNVDGLVFKQQWTENDQGFLEAPLHIEIQLQHQLLVSGRKYGYIGALIGGNRLELLKRVRNKTVLDKIKEKSKAFWESIEDNTPPEPNFQTDSEFIASLYGYAEPGKYKDLTGDEDILAFAELYKQYADQEKEAKAQKKGVKAKLLTIIGDAEKAGYEGLFSISAGLVGPTHIEYDREGYRNFRVNWKKQK